MGCRRLWSLVNHLPGMASTFGGDSNWLEIHEVSAVGVELFHKANFKQRRGRQFRFPRPERPAPKRSVRARAVDFARVLRKGD